MKRCLGVPAVPEPSNGGSSSMLTEDDVGFRPRRRRHLWIFSSFQFPILPFATLVARHPDCRCHCPRAVLLVFKVTIRCTPWPIMAAFVGLHQKQCHTGLLGQDATLPTAPAAVGGGRPRQGRLFLMDQRQHKRRRWLRRRHCLSPKDPGPGLRSHRHWRSLPHELG